MKIAGIILDILIIAILFIFIIAPYKLKHVKDNKNLKASIDKLLTKHINEDKLYGIVVGVFKQGEIYN